MGFFSWNTSDTDESIPNRYSERGTFTVYMVDNNNNVWQEDNYEGYGIFGGKDFYELLAEMNGLSDRDEGIKLFFDPRELFVKRKSVIHPNIFRHKPLEWVNKHIKDCDYQGYFYG
jgi:hypothetical protein